MNVIYRILTVENCLLPPVQYKFGHMKEINLPFALSPGRRYRRDTSDATHSANFHQIEGLYIDEEVSSLI